MCVRALFAPGLVIFTAAPSSHTKKYAPAGGRLISRHASKIASAAFQSFRTLFAPFACLIGAANRQMEGGHPSDEAIVPEGMPKAVKFRNRLLQVKEILKAWRIDDGWWRTPISRLYYLVEFTSGSRFTVFQGLVTGQWRRQNRAPPAV